MADVLGIKPFYKSDGSAGELMAVYGNDIFKYVSGSDSWVGQGQNVTSSTSKADARIFLDKQYWTNYVDTIRKYDGTSWTVESTAPKAKYIENWLTRLWVANVTVDATNYPSRVYYSNLPEDNLITWSNGDNWFDVKTDDGDVITGLSVNSNRLLIFKANSFHLYDGSTLRQGGSVGSTSAKSIVSMKNGSTIWFHRTGFWMLLDGALTLISRPMQKWIDGIAGSFVENVVAWEDGDYYKAYVDDVDNTDANISENKVVLVYDSAQQNWWVERLNHKLTSVCKFVESGTESIYAGDSTNHIWKMSDDYDDNGAGIPVEIETRTYFPAGPSTLKLFDKIHIFTRNGGNFSIQYSIDGKEYVDIGDIDDDFKEFIMSSGSNRGRGIKFRVMESSNSDPAVLEGIVVFYTTQGLK